MQLQRHDKKLIRYSEFLRKNGANIAAIQKVVSPSALLNWWVYLGQIPPHKIDTTLPAALALECFDHHIATHPDIEARVRYKALRAQVVSLAPDDPVSLEVRA